MRTDMVRSYVETLLESLTGSQRVDPDADGDYPVRYRQALYYVRLVGDSEPVIQVFSVAVEGVPKTAKLLSRLNEINADIRFARVFWVRDQVLVETDLVGATIDPPEFNNACHAVATITDHYGPALATEFGGRTAFADEKDAAVKDTEPGRSPYDADKALTGLYL